MRYLLLTIALLVSCVSSVANAQAALTTPGWFWYHDPALEDSETSPPPSEAQPPTDSGSEVSVRSTPSYSTAWIRENLPKLLDVAVDSPTPENVRAYFYVQRLAMDRASEFQSTAAFVTSADPFLDQVSRFPTSTKGAAVGAKRADESKEETLYGLSRTAGIWFFYRSDCQYCHAMVPVLLMIKRMYGFTIIPVSLDGLPLDPRLPNFTVDRGQAAQLGVEVTPSFFLVRPPNTEDVVPLAQGFVALPDLEERIVRMAYFHGWIDQGQYDRTRIVTPLRLNDTNTITQTLDPAEIVRQLRPTQAQVARPTPALSTPVNQR